VAREAHSSRPPRRKRFGQHFLHDPAAIRRIVAALAPRAGDHLVEIGPGRGALTRQLLGFADCTLDAVEIDRDLAAQLAASFAGDARHSLHVADALEFDFTGLARSRGGRLRIVGNLPYNISTPLLFHLLAHADAILDAHVMLQREVVVRIAAQPGGADYGRLTVMLAPRVSVERLFDLGPGAFQPPPRVWSAVVRLTVRQPPLFAVRLERGPALLRATRRLDEALPAVGAAHADAAVQHEAAVDFAGLAVARLLLLRQLDV